MKKLPLFLTVTILLFCSNVFSQTQSKVFIAPMENGLNEFLTAAIIKEKVPVKVVISEDDADYVITGVAIKGTGKWYDTVFGSEKDRNQGSIKLLKLSDKSLVWAGAAGDKRGFWSPSWTKTGLNKVALRLAKQMKKEYFNGKLKN